jgi:hypothetical protein
MPIFTPYDLRVRPAVQLKRSIFSISLESFLSLGIVAGFTDRVMSLDFFD